MNQSQWETLGVQVMDAGASLLLADQRDQGRELGSSSRMDLHQCPCHWQQ